MALSSLCHRGVVRGYGLGGAFGCGSVGDGGFGTLSLHSHAVAAGGRMCYYYNSNESIYSKHSPDSECVVYSLAGIKPYQLDVAFQRWKLEKISIRELNQLRSR